VTDITQAIAVLQAGGLVAYPTETFYGIGACIDRPDALARLWALKEREGGGALPLLVPGPADLASLAAPGALDGSVFARLAAHFWPGPLTLVVDARPGLDARLVGPDGGVAARVSSHPLAAELVGRLARPLTSTSANWHGLPPARSTDQIRGTGLAAVLDFVLEGGQTAGGPASTLVRLGDGRVRVLRDGAVSREALITALQGLAVEIA
jgi:L-threonylcarbamoyladenylate synthase